MRQDESDIDAALYCVLDRLADDAAFREEVRVLSEFLRVRLLRPREVAALRSTADAVEARVFGLLDTFDAAVFAFGMNPCPELQNACTDAREALMHALLPLFAAISTPNGAA